MKITNIELVSAIVRGVWAIDEAAANSYLPTIQNILEKKDDFEVAENDFENIAAISNGVSVVRSRRREGFNEAPPNSVALVNIQGALMKGDQFCGPSGMATIGDTIKAADNSENITAIVLKIDSPGGTVDGTETLVEIIKGTNKPVVAFVDGLMASAALWIGSAANEIIASNDMDQIGSIGVMMGFADVQPALEKMGVKFHTILAEQSKDKNRMFADLKEGNYEEYRETVLNPLADRFISAVKENRPNVKDEHLTGSVFFAKDVEGILVDNIATFDDAIIRAFNMGQVSGVAYTRKNSQLANSEEGENNSQINNKNHVSMTKQELQSQHPALYNELQSEQKEAATAAVALERDRVGSFMAFMDVDPEGVKKGIQSGESMTETQRSEFAIKAHQKIVLDSEKGDSTAKVETPAVPKQKDDSDQAEQALDAALKEKGLNLKN